MYAHKFMQLLCGVNNLTSLQAGKSSFINSLLGKAVLPVYTLSSSSLAPTTTSLPQEVTLEAAGKQIRFIDTPGLSWSASPDASIDEYDSLRARHILLRNKGRIDRLKDSTFACSFAPPLHVLLCFHYRIYSGAHRLSC